MAKPFFYRIDAAEFVAAVLQIPDGQHKQWVTQLALDMVSGVGTMDFSKKIIEEVENYRKKQAEAGAKGGKPKHKQPYSDPISGGNDTTTTPKQNIARSSNRSSTEAKEETKDLKPLSEYSDDFLLFWKAYPKKVAKGAAWKEWKKERPSVNAVLDALEWQTETQKWKDGYILDPERYIKKRCWEDEKPQKTAAAPKPNGPAPGTPERQTWLNSQLAL